MKVEVCVTSVAGARIAEAAGADRLELCAELAVGGVTPSPGLLKAVKQRAGIPVHVLIRPRSGGFYYSEQEVEQMLSDIAYCRELGYEGFAVGALLEDGHLDRGAMAAIASAAGDAHLTFHRAFDRLLDGPGTLPVLEELGVQTILSSGAARSAVAGLEHLLRLQAQTNIGIMPGGGIRPGNVHRFVGKGFSAIHLSGLPELPDEDFRGPPLNSPALLRETSHPAPDAGLIRKVISVSKTPGK